jgi:hypothetical protein
MAAFGSDNEKDPDNKDVLLALAIASGATAAEAAGQLNLSVRTVHRRQADPDFRTLVADIRAQTFERAFGCLTDHMTRAAQKVAALIDHKDPVIQLRAARTLLTLGLRMHDAVDLTERVRRLEDELDHPPEDLP